MFPLISYMKENGMPIVIPWGVNKEELLKEINYGTHSSSQKEKTFVIREIVEQLRVGHVSIFPWYKVKRLSGLWIYPLAAIPQIGRKSHLIYDFSLIALNGKADQDSQK